MKHLILLFFVIFTSYLIVTCNKDETDTDLNGTFVDDRDEHIYKWTQIGEQVWMAENLSYLPNVSPPSLSSYTDLYYYVYDYNSTDVFEAKYKQNYTDYGVLYNWSAALTACPSGWHLPNDDEWEQLAQYVSEQKGHTAKYHGMIGTILVNI